MADNLSKAGWVGAAFQRLIPTGKQSGLLMRVATMETGSLCDMTTNILALSGYSLGRSETLKKFHSHVLPLSGEKA